MTGNKKTLKSILFRAAALLTCILVAALSLGCGAPGEEADERFGMSDAQYEYLMRLASAFRVFGEYDVTRGYEFNKLEYIVFCWFSSYINESEPAGFGTVSAEDADAVIKSVFGNISIFDVMRRKYDESVEQTYYFEKGVYKVMLTDDSAYTYRITSFAKDADGDANDYTAVVIVLREGVEELELSFRLIASGDEFRVKSCTVLSWY